MEILGLCSIILTLILIYKYADRITEYLIRTDEIDEYLKEFDEYLNNLKTKDLEQK